MINVKFKTEPGLGALTDAEAQAATSLSKEESAARTRSGPCGMH